MLRYLVTRVLGMAVMIVLATLVVFLIANRCRPTRSSPSSATCGGRQSAGRRLSRQMGARSAAVGALLHFPHRTPPRRPRHLDLDAAPGARRHRAYAPATIELATAGFLLAVLVGIPLGVIAAVRRDSWIDHVARLLSLIGVSSPTFWLAFIMLAIFYGGLQIAPGPAGSTRSLAAAGGHRALSGRQLARRRLGHVPRRAAHLVLPGIVLAAATLGLITRTTRAAMLECMNQDYVRVARAKGMTERAIVLATFCPMRSFRW